MDSGQRAPLPATCKRRSLPPFFACPTALTLCLVDHRNAPWRSYRSRGHIVCTRHLRWKHPSANFFSVAHTHRSIQYPVNTGKMYGAPQFGVSMAVSWQLAPAPAGADPRARSHSTLSPPHNSPSSPTVISTSLAVPWRAGCSLALARAPRWLPRPSRRP